MKSGPGNQKALKPIVLTVQGPGGVPLSFDMVRLVATGAQ